MAEIPVEHKKAAAFPMWLIPLILVLLLLPLLYFCSRNTAVVGNTNANANRSVVVANANNSVVNARNSVNGAVAAGDAAAFNEEERIREANERARLAMAKAYPNGTVQQVIDALNLSIVNFAEGSNDVPESSKPLLKQAAEIIKKSPADTRVELDGYTDSEGDDSGNQKLSERRAASVRNQLINYGVPPAMLLTKGFGETNPKATNDTAEGRFQNRRIEYKVATGDATAEKVAPNGK